MMRVGEPVQIGNGRARWQITALSGDEKVAFLTRVGSRLKTTVPVARIHTPIEVEVLQRDAARRVLLDIQKLHRGRKTVSPYNPRNKETRCVECQKVHPCPSWLAVEKLKERA